MVTLGSILADDANRDRIQHRVVRARNTQRIVQLIAHLLGESAAVEVEGAQPVRVERRELLEEILVIGQAGRAIGPRIQRCLEGSSMRVLTSSASSDHVRLTRSVDSGNWPDHRV